MIFILIFSLQTWNLHILSFQGNFQDLRLEISLKTMKIDFQVNFHGFDVKFQDWRLRITLKTMKTDLNDTF